MYFDHNKFPLPPDCSQTPASLHPFLSKFDILTPPLLICVGHMLMGMDHPLELTYLGPHTLRKLALPPGSHQLSVAPWLTPHPTVP